MPTLLRYQLSDGTIVSAWSATDAAALAAQVWPDDSGHGTVMSDEVRDMRAWNERWTVVAGQLREKDRLTIIADPASFPADGVTVCSVSVEPFIPCTVLVSGQSQALTPEDPTLTLTADTPQRFVLTLAPMTLFFAEPLSVEAT